MTRALLFLIFMSLAVCKLQAQQDPVYSQYMFNQLAINPAYAGMNDNILVGLDLRSMWSNITGSPTTTNLHANAPVKPFGLQSGIGLSYVYDEIGFEKDNYLTLSYSYKINIRNGKLGIGINLGGNFGSLVPDAGGWVPPSGNANSDNSIPATETNKGKANGFDLGLGTYYKTDNLYMGFSVKHLLATHLKYTLADYKVNMSYNLLAGYRVQLANPAFEIQPSTFISSDGKISQITLNSNVMYNKKIWGGIGYRLGDSFIPSFGLELFNGLQAGFSYDFTTSYLSTATTGSWEVTLRYAFNLKVDKIPQRYKSVRFL